MFPEHPVGAQVELYGYSSVLSENSPMKRGETVLDYVRWVMVRKRDPESPAPGSRAWSRSC